ncbi:isoprenyl transferase [Candidatus Acetothermia bacterium]|nr:isoprenyl transferase [Candidatus Acetothermia bacterium]MBI3459888.1 isoprenyl transferase [Candidatus Acetothermia bacterium]MBI3660509.1 isoprenyl transferase [Candidatus Acetothermia bacterium]
MATRPPLVSAEPRRSELLAIVKQRPLPEHIAIIMDGNGRWAACRGRERTFGHRQGLETASQIVEFVGQELKIKHLTLFAFSKENWRRPRAEVDFLMNLLIDFVQRKLDELLRNNVRLRVLGEVSELPAGVRAEVERAVVTSEDNDGLYLNLAINYGGRQELVRVTQAIARDCAAGRLSPDHICENTLAHYLYTQDLPDPDLLIRTSGEERVSNFLLWQIAYTEFWFTETLWPDFSKEELLRAIADFQRRQRKFGTVVEP